MNDQPVSFEIDINEFDFEILPLKIDIDLLRKDRKLRERAVTLFYENHLEGHREQGFFLRNIPLSVSETTQRFFCNRNFSEPLFYSRPSISIK